jgi:hypothetical protein
MTFATTKRQSKYFDKALSIDPTNELAANNKWFAGSLMADNTIQFDEA